MVPYKPLPLSGVTGRRLDSVRSAGPRRRNPAIKILLLYGQNNITLSVCL
jgi:hypothetical protein